MARPASRRRREIDPPIPLEGLRFEDVRLKGVESREELKARISRDSTEAAHRVWRDSILFGIVVSGVVIVSLTCLWMLITPGQSAEQQKWATTLLTTIVSAGVGYLTGKANKSS